MEIKSSTDTIKFNNHHHHTKHKSNNYGNAWSKIYGQYITPHTYKTYKIFD